MPRTENEPYWLVREIGKEVGFHTIDFGDETPTPEAALAAFRKMWDEKWAPHIGAAPPVIVELVKLTYVDGKPVVEQVRTRVTS